jgi:hypothetical protein
MKGLKAYGLIIVSMVLLYLFLEWAAPRSVSWDSDYSPNSKDPYGTWVFRQRIQDLFPGHKVNSNSKNYYKLWLEDKTYNHNLIIIRDAIWTDKSTIAALLRFVRQGNTVFISTSYLNRTLSDTLGINRQYIPYMSDEHVVKCTLKEFPNNTGYFIQKNETYYLDVDAARFPVKILGNNKGPNFLRFRIGKGYLYMHSSPRAFTNYPLLRGETDKYVEAVMAYLPQQDVYWDVSLDKTTEQDIEEEREIKELLKDPMMKIAYYLALGLFLLFIIIKIKREQRAIPVVEPPRNDSLALAGSVTQLYLQNNNHKPIADKIIRHFFDYIQNRYYLSYRTLDRQFIEKLSKKSGIDMQTVSQLIQLIQQIRESEYIDDNTLLLLNDRIEKFKNKKAKS